MILQKMAKSKQVCLAIFTSIEPNSRYIPEFGNRDVWDLRQEKKRQRGAMAVGAAGGVGVGRKGGVGVARRKQEE